MKTSNKKIVFNRLREGVELCDRDALNSHLLDLHKEHDRFLNNFDDSKVNETETIGLYDSFIRELLALGPSKNKSPILVSYIEEKDDDFAEEDYINVCCFNMDYVQSPPSERLDPWGGASDKRDDCPDGYYNINWSGYCEFFGISGLDWASHLDEPVYMDQAIADMGLSKELILAHILWELTFHGFSVESVELFWNTIEEARQEAMKEGHRDGFDDFWKSLDLLDAEEESREDDEGKN